MTGKEEINKERLNVSLEKCRLHIKRLQYAASQINSLFPINLNTYNKLSEASIGNIDQLVFRFTKLQDESTMNFYHLN